MCCSEPPTNGSPVAITLDTICSHFTHLRREVVPTATICGFEAIYNRLLRMTICQHISPLHGRNTCACGEPAGSPAFQPRGLAPGPRSVEALLLYGIRIPPTASISFHAQAILACYTVPTGI